MTEVFFKGATGRIEGQYIQALNPKAPAALLLHPPLQVDGGMTNNQIVNCLYKTLHDCGFSVLRINFKESEKSDNLNEGEGELMDASIALDWLQSHNQLSHSNLIVGFSFGAWIGMQLIMRRPEISNYIAVALPLSKFDFSFLSPCPISGLIVQGNQDSVVLEEDVANLVDKLVISQQKTVSVEYKVINGADHFFRNKLPELSTTIKSYIDRAIVQNSPIKGAGDLGPMNNEKSNITKVLLD